MTNAELLVLWGQLNGQSRPQFHERDWCAPGYAEHPGLFRTSADDHYRLRLSPTKRPQPLLQEGLLAARSLVSKFQGEQLLLMLSGGLDSEFMLNCFLKIKANFRVGIIRHANGANAHDLAPALRLVHGLGLDYMFFELDTLDMLKSQTALEWARVSQCKHLGYVPWCLAVSEWSKQYICISGFNEPEVMWCPDVEAQMRGDYRTGHWVFADHERYPSFQRFLMFANNHRVIPSFYQWRPELWSSFFLHPLTRRMVAGLYNRRIYSTDVIKYQMYGLKTRIKFTGYERVLTQLFSASEALRLGMPFSCNSSYEVPYKDTLVQLGLEKS